jgi:hypothetical protein
MVLNAIRTAAARLKVRAYIAPVFALMFALILIQLLRCQAFNTNKGDSVMFNFPTRGNTRNAVVVAALLAAFGGARGEPPDIIQQPDNVVSAGQDVGAEAANAARLPTVCAGFNVRLYANVPGPEKLSFGPDGALYVGRGVGNIIHRVAPGGRSFAEFGPPQIDPDAVLADPTGRISGVRNSVLVGGDGVLAAIFQNQSSRVIFNSGFDDVDDMKFDHAGRLIFSDDLQQVLVSTGNAPTVLFSLPDRPGSIAIDVDDRIYVALADGTIRIYTPDGTLADAAFASGLAGLDTYLAFGPGAGGFGRALYVLNGGDLLRFDRNGKSDRIGSGFNVGPSSGTGFVFGPDGALYVSDYNENRILRISRGFTRHHQQPCPLR